MRNDHGFTLTELMVSIGIFSVALMAIAFMTTTTQKSIAMVTGVSEVNALMQEVYIALGSAEQCALNFKGLEMKSGSKHPIKIYHGNGIDKTSEAAAAGMKIGNIATIKNISFAPKAELTTKRWLAHLDIEIDLGETAMGAKVTNRKIPVLAEVNDTGDLESCNLSGFESPGEDITQKDMDIACSLINYQAGIGYFWDATINNGDGRCIPEFEKRSFWTSGGSIGCKSGFTPLKSTTRGPCRSALKEDLGKIDIGGKYTDGGTVIEGPPSIAVSYNSEEERCYCVPAVGVVDPLCGITCYNPDNPTPRP